CLQNLIQPIGHPMGSNISDNKPIVKAMLLSENLSIKTAQEIIGQSKIGRIRYHDQLALRDVFSMKKCLIECRCQNINKLSFIVNEVFILIGEFDDQLVFENTGINCRFGP